jgi:RNA polymerase sigma factor (sigma-70 family)
MAQLGAGRVVGLIQTLRDAGTVAAMDDAELLARFLRRDAAAEAAFEALVRRHAPMVLRVCREVTGDPHDAQDAAQVTFLVLARHAGSIHRGRALASWLFGTARRVSARLVRDAARRRRHERRYAEDPGRRPAADGGDCDPDRAGLYEELERLPGRYRLPIVLCDLEGLTHDQAATAIGCRVRTLQTRLYRGRERLRERLARRGLAPAVGLAGGSPTAVRGRMAVPVAWARVTTAAATRLAEGRAEAASIPEAVNRLFHGVVRAMFLSRLKRLAMVVFLIGCSAGLGSRLAAIAPGDAKTVPPAAETDDASPKAPLTTPITVRGRATDDQGRAIVGATIYLISTGEGDALLATTTTDRDGTYIFRDARLPVSRSGWVTDGPLQGTFQVYGTAPGLGFAWHPRRDYQPRRPDDWEETERAASEHPRVGYQVPDLAPRVPTTLFGGDPKVMDLRFGPAADVRGRVLDEAGRPLPGVTIRLGECDPLDAKGQQPGVGLEEPWVIGGAAAAAVTTTTGPDGSFRLEGLPREAGLRIHVEHPEYASQIRYAATTDRPASALRFRRPPDGAGQQPPVATGALEIRLRSTRRIAVRTVFADTGQPAPKVRVCVASGPSESSVYGTSDAEGKLALRLPPGDHAILADPTDGGAACIRTNTALHVADRPAEQSLQVRVNPACVLIIEVVDAGTNQGIPGVAFLTGTDSAGQTGTLLPLDMYPVYIGDRQTDAAGLLRGVVEPGDWIYTVGRIYGVAGYPGPYPRKRVSLPAHGSVTLRFELRE